MTATALSSLYSRVDALDWEELGDRLGQRAVEVAVAAVAEAVAGHVDGGAEAAAVEEAGELGALRRVEEGLGHREAAGVEVVSEVVPWQRVDARGERALGDDGGHIGEAIGRTIS